ncbi:hypothetical protein EMPS_05535 [Entomortierella parvispora]|uniref:Uncharacterized protein n=1 Tax=Entomortierella parvispora TaxID=205924 RepID=A0A9P3LWK5_9FUNG|nr:hypothetical protein EMPS_05535 [Entomortierella parvispora]
MILSALTPVSPLLRHRLFNLGPLLFWPQHGFKVVCLPTLDFGYKTTASSSSTLATRPPTSSGSSPGVDVVFPP